MPTHRGTMQSMLGTFLAVLSSSAGKLKETLHNTPELAGRRFLAAVAHLPAMFVISFHCLT